MGLFIYYLFIANSLLFIFFCHIFYLLTGEGGIGFIFLPFCYFLYCVLSFCYCFLLLLGERGCGFFNFLKLLFYIFLINLLFLLMEGQKGAQAF